jgi:uridine kinase
MKHALLISGYLRCFKEVFPLLKENLLNENNIDIYIHITIEKEKKYNNKSLSVEETITLLNPKFALISNNFYFSVDKRQNDLLNQNYKFYILNEKRKEIEKIEKITYTNIIKLRPDVYLQQKLDLNHILDKIYIPIDSKIDINMLLNTSDNHVCDIIAYGNAENMNEYFSFYNQLIELIDSHGTINETLLYWFLKNNNLVYELIDIKYIIVLSLCNTIAITGDSGSGKTILSNIIKGLFNNSFVLECDRYHKWERGNIKWCEFTHLNPEANYLTKMENDVFDLKIGNTIYQVDYDHNTGKFTDKQIIESKENIIVCGLHSLYIPENIVNLKIYMDTDDNLRIPWKIKRDIHKRGYTMDKIVEQINYRKKDFDEYIFPQREKADMIINFYTNKIFNIDEFNAEDEIPVCLRIGIKSIFAFDKITESLNIDKIEKEGNFVYIYFGNDFDYENIIKKVCLNFN